MAKEKRPVGRPRTVYTPEEKLIITGRKKTDGQYIIVHLPGVVKDSLKVYSIIHKLDGLAGSAVKHMIDNNDEIQTIVRYMKEQQTSVKRAEVIHKMIKGKTNE